MDSSSGDPLTDEPWRRPDGSVDWSHAALPDSVIEPQPVAPEELGVVRFERVEYATVPLKDWRYFPASCRLLLALHFAYRTWPPDDQDGWYRLSVGLYTRASLTDSAARSRAAAKLERDGKIEVRRDGTRTLRVRLIDPGPKRVSGHRPTPRRAKV